MVSFGFYTDKTGQISVSGQSIQIAEENQTSSGLNVMEKRRISLIGGDILIHDKAQFQAPAGNIQLISVGSKGSVALSNDGVQMHDFTRLGEIIISDQSIIDASGTGNQSASYVYANNQWLPFFQSGKAGKIDINATTIKMDHQSSISTSTSGNGDAGNISVNANNALLNHASKITSESLSLFAGGDAGSVEIKQNTSSGSLNIFNKSSILTDSISSGGGKISIYTGQVVLLNSNITTNVMLGNKDTGGQFGNGGDIKIESQQFALNNSHVTANAIDGDGGAIFIVSDHFIKSTDNIIEASSKRGNEGTVEIVAPDMDMDSQITILPTDFLNASKWLKAPCDLRNSQQSSKLIYRRHVVPSLNQF